MDCPATNIEGGGGVVSGALPCGGGANGPPPPCKARAFRYSRWAMCWSPNPGPPVLDEKAEGLPLSLSIALGPDTSELPGLIWRSGRGGRGWGWLRGKLCLENLEISSSAIFVG